MNNIVIDGSIMPLRNGVTAYGQPFAKVLRGEDVTFLLEAFSERMNIVSWPYYERNWTFHRTLGTDMRSLLSLIYTTIYVTFFDAVPDESYDVPVGWFTNWAMAHSLTETDITVARTAFDAGEKLLQYNMSGMFDTMRKMDTIWSDRATQESSTGIYLETQSMDDDYPYVPQTTSSDFGYMSYGGRQVTDSEGNIHPNAYGGWQIRLSEGVKYSDSAGYSEIKTIPSSNELFAFESYFRYDNSSQTDTRHQVIKIGDVVINNNNHCECEDPISNQRARLVAAMQRYWGLSPAFVSADTTVAIRHFVGERRTFAKVGSHTKWW